MSKQPLQIYDFRNPDEAFKLMIGTHNDELQQKLYLATKMWAKWYSEYCEKEKQVADLSKTIERLQEQLNEANEVIKYYTDYHYELNNKGKMVYKETNTASKYLEKWGVK